MNDKTDLFLDIINAPDRFFDKELDMLLDDEELKEIHNAVSKATDAITETPEADIDREWMQFSQKHHGHNSIGFISMLSGFFSRNAAAAVCAVASLAVVATTIGVHYSTRQPDIQHQQPTTAQTDVAKENNVNPADSVVEPGLPAVSDQRIIFKNQPLDYILSSIAEHHGTAVNFKTAATKELRLYFQWNKSQSLDETIEQLNSFEQLNIKLIDNVITIE